MKILNIYKILLNEFGKLDWWPLDKKYHKKNNSDPRFEIIVGAILTQNTAWSNVEKAIKNLKNENILDIKSISKIDIAKLKEFIRPSGFYNQKAGIIKEFVRYIEKKYNGNLEKFLKKDIKKLRKELLSLNGIGPETADSIILYAAKKPIFVVDAYTKRLILRLGFDVKSSYMDIQKYFEKNLSKHFSKKELTLIYNQMHALIVIFAKSYCKKKPLCVNCPLKKFCNFKAS